MESQSAKMIGDMDYPASKKLLLRLAGPFHLPHSACSARLLLVSFSF
jgi:hypothetical protein